MSQISNYSSGGVIPPGTYVGTLTGNTGGAVPPDLLDNINILGTGVISVAGNIGTNTLTISGSGALGSSFPTDSGTATPALGILNVFGGTAARDINTSGSGNTIHIDLNNTITLGDLSVVAANAPALTLTTGDILVSNGNIRIGNTNAAGDKGEIKIGGDRWISNFGTNNSFVGANSGNTTNTATAATGVGFGAFQLLTSGSGDAFGSGTLSKATSSLGNSFFGSAGGGNITTSPTNVGLGTSVLAALTTGSGLNTGLGFGSILQLVTGTNNVAIGAASASTWTTAESNNICISSPGVILDSGVIRIGTNGVQTSAFIAGIDGVNVGSTAKVVTMGTAGTADKLGTATITAGTGISVTPGANTITLAVNGSVVGQTITGDSGGPLSPTAGNWNIVGGLNTVTSGSVSTLTVAASQAQYLTNYRVANATPFVVNSTDFYITVDTTTIPITIQLPNAPTNYRRFIIKDSGGLAASNNITVTTVGGILNIDAAPTFVMNTNYQAIELMYSGFGYEIF